MIMRTCCCFIAYICSGVFFTQASTTLGSTRVIYPANEREVTVRLHNPEHRATLVQAWIDNGNINATPDDTMSPFIIMPPLVRINAGQGSTLKIIFTHQEQLPKDKESVFWLNFQDVPPILKGNENNYMQLAYRTRVKLFYRPEKLPGNSNQAAKDVSWTVSNNINGSRELTGCNKSAFYVSLNKIMLTVSQVSYFNNDGGMIAPAECADFPVTATKKIMAGIDQVDAEWIDDYGALHQQREALNR